MPKRRAARADESLFRSVLFGILISAVCLILTTIIISVVIFLTDNPLKIAGIGALVSLILSAALSALIITGRTPDGKYLTLIICSLSLVLIIALLGSLLGGFGLKLILNMLAYFGTSLVIGYWGTKERKRKRA